MSYYGGSSMEKLISSDKMFGSKELCEVYFTCLVIMCIIWAVMVAIEVVIYSVFQVIHRVYSLSCNKPVKNNDIIEGSLDIKDSMGTGDVLSDFVLKYDNSSDDVDLWR